MSSGQQRKALDPRIQHLITNGVLQSHRSFLVMIGSAKEQQRQIVNLHYLLSQARLSHASTAAAAASSSKAASRPTVLWTYKKELGFTSNRKKRESKVKRDIKRGIRQEGELDPFELFVGVTDIRYTYYKDTDKILGQTFGMLVLQDFEAITPNLLARTIETVEGGGLVVLLLQSLTSLKQLYTMSMDVHARYRTESSAAPVARFNERFILSLGTCSTCLVLDDELNVLPISQAKSITALEPKSVTHPASVELASLKSKLADTKLVGEIVKEARTIDQAQAILTFTDAISSKTLSSTVTLTAARGRGKSAALGLSIALAVAHSYSNIFVTSPSPENLKTLFEFLLKGFDKLGYEEHLDYDVVQSSNAEWKGAVVRVNVFREHRQTIQVSLMSYSKRI
jgi:N-acetyltransferase 10